MHLIELLLQIAELRLEHADIAVEVLYLALIVVDVFLLGARLKGIEPFLLKP